MSDESHKIDKRIKPQKLGESVGLIHDLGLDLPGNQLYLCGVENYSQSVEEGEPGIDYRIATQFIKNLNILMRASDKPILIHMKTGGGDWVEGMAIFDAIKACPNPVTILNYTQASSMSSIIFQAANKRVMMPNSHFMFHEGNAYLPGTAKQVISAAEFYKRDTPKMLEIYVERLKRTGCHKKKSEKQILQWLKKQMDAKEDVFLSAEETVFVGFADEVFGGNGVYDWASLTEYTEEQLTL